MTDLNLTDHDRRVLVIALGRTRDGFPNPESIDRLAGRLAAPDRELHQVYIEAQGLWTEGRTALIRRLAAGGNIDDEATPASGSKVLLDRDGLLIEDNGNNVALVLDGEARVGLWFTGDDGDPQLTICNDEAHSGEALIVLHLDDINFNQPPEAARAALLAKLNEPI